LRAAHTFGSADERRGTCEFSVLQRFGFCTRPRDPAAHRPRCGRGLGTRDHTITYFLRTVGIAALGVGRPLVAELQLTAREAEIRAVPAPTAPTGTESGGEG
jgi:hypothetical protein